MCLFFAPNHGGSRHIVFVGIGALAIPGIGPLIAAGPLLAAFSGAAAGGAVGGIAGALIGMGVPELEAKRYENRIAEGNILISVHAVDSDQVDRAKEVLKNANSEDISVTSMGEAKPSRTVNIHPWNLQKSMQSCLCGAAFFNFPLIYGKPREKSAPRGTLIYV